MRKCNAICPVCRLKRLFSVPSAVSEIYDGKPYDNNAAATPPMGWSSWNTFKNRIDQELIYETAVAMKEKGLVDAGYVYVNIDDNWASSERDADGNLQADLTTFSDGISALAKKVNALGEKLGIYSSNGTLTCEDLPASLHREKTDALTIAEWGVEYFKYDFCHNEPISDYAPLVYAVEIAKKGTRTGRVFLCKNARLEGYARFMNCRKIEGGRYVSGLDRNEGAMTFDNVTVDDTGDYVLTVHIKKSGNFKKALMIKINDDDCYVIEFPPQKFYNTTAKFQTVVRLKSGVNKIRLFNPVKSKADSAMLQYQKMGRELKLAAARVAEENGVGIKPIVFSVCEWGWRQPYKWGATAGNLWRTTPDISPHWKWITVIYERNVRLYKYAQIGGWNDPDMLEVGNGKLTYDENISHFSLWCMMCAPLILGNDVRAITRDILDIVTNRKMIAVNQDALGKQAKRVEKGSVDVLVKPLSDGSVAVCVFNRKNRAKKYVLDVGKIVADAYSRLEKSDSYVAENLWNGANFEIKDSVTIELNPHGSVVLKISKS